MASDNAKQSIVEIESGEAEHISHYSRPELESSPLTFSQRKGLISLENASKLNMSSGYRLIKRLFDVLVSLLGLLILSPVLFITAIAIKIEDPKGSVIFKQPRFGFNTSQFLMYKFRSMFSNAEELLNGLTSEQMKEWKENFKIDNDPRITKIGSFIRKTSIDELPQLLNILVGDMSFVGPRPPLLAEKEAYGDSLNTVLSVRPGLTGYWQAYGRNNISFAERIQMNLFYIQHISVWMDLKIVGRTFVSVISREGAL